MARGTERLPFRIYQVDDEDSVPVFTLITTVVAATEEQALHDFLARRPATGEKFVAQAWDDHGVPRPKAGGA